LGATLGLRIVAEGIEDPAALDTLRELGCDTGQGYYISRPLAAAQFRTWLAAETPGEHSRLRLIATS
jgi:diguanylate cyclase